MSKILNDVIKEFGEEIVRDCSDTMLYDYRYLEYEDTYNEPLFSLFRKDIKVSNKVFNYIAELKPTKEYLSKIMANAYYIAIEQFFEQKIRYEMPEEFVEDKKLCKDLKVTYYDYDGHSLKFDYTITFDTKNIAQKAIKKLKENNEDITVTNIILTINDLIFEVKVNYHKYLYSRIYDYDLVDIEVTEDNIEDSYYEFELAEWYNNTMDELLELENIVELSIDEMRELDF